MKKKKSFKTPLPQPLPTLETVEKLLDYNPQTGVFTWKPRENNDEFNQKLAGKRAGSGRHTFREIKIINTVVPEQSLAVLLTHGYYPKYVRHIDSNLHNNAITNLQHSNYLNHIQTMSPR